MDSKAITIAIESSAWDNFAILGAGLSSEELKSIAIVWSSEASHVAPDALPSRGKVPCVSSILKPLQQGTFAASLVVSQENFSALLETLRGSRLKLTITNGAQEFAFQQVASAHSEGLPLLAKVAEAPLLTLGSVESLENGSAAASRSSMP